ncbi:MAG: hypothetical protein ACE5H3_09425 [Planctomycetota bacterium]
MTPVILRAAVIEPVPLPAPEEDASSGPTPSPEPVTLEDLAAAVRIPHLFRKVGRILEGVRASLASHPDLPMQASSDGPGDGVRQFGLTWSDEKGLLTLFAGLSWGEEGHDPLWEVRLEAQAGFDPDLLRRGGLHAIAARRAGTRFTEWDRFWHEDTPGKPLLLGASVAGTRFLEEEDPDATAAEYLSGALYALSASGALGALIQAARESASLA